MAGKRLCRLCVQRRSAIENLPARIRQLQICSVDALAALEGLNVAGQFRQPCKLVGALLPGFVVRAIELCCDDPNLQRPAWGRWEFAIG